jgi:hypothetical protein
MAKIARFVGMDVHAETIAVAIAEGPMFTLWARSPTAPTLSASSSRSSATPQAFGSATRRGPPVTSCTGSSLAWASTATSL